MRSTDNVLHPFRHNINNDADSCDTKHIQRIINNSNNINTKKQSHWLVNLTLIDIIFEIIIILLQLKTILIGVLCHMIYAIITTIQQYTTINKKSKTNKVGVDNGNILIEQGSSLTSPYDVLVIGAGMGGIGCAAQLLERNINNFIIVERSDNNAGTYVLISFH